MQLRQGKAIEPAFESRFSDTGILNSKSELISWHSTPDVSRKKIQNLWSLIPFTAWALNSEKPSFVFFFNLLNYIIYCHVT